MSNLSNRIPEFLGSEGEGGNLLWQYIQSLHPETVAQLSNPSVEVVQVMERNLAGVLGTLPHEQFGVTITTSRAHLGRLLASAMISGYFLHNAEQRMGFEKYLQGTAEPNEAV
ncbi:MAG TPA: hypothetical protein DDZ80_06665 [Cyanobacteria bacterium UBA8803]|nr:hypothetical protein [Cyanobacteria bacterium UBA9273]HBL58206.1 hypothetical protein [Cyanobacteria bacterium UBA8803]